MNGQRAIRITEIMGDFRNLQYHIAQVRGESPGRDDYYAEGYAVSRRCTAEAQALLSAYFDPTLPPACNGNGEQEKAQLQR